MLYQEQERSAQETGVLQEYLDQFGTAGSHGVYAADRLRQLAIADSAKASE